MNYRYALIVLFVFGASACATTQSSPADASDSRMLGLGDEPQRPIWEGWTPAPAPSLSVETREPLEAFDFWHIDDPAYVESAWATLSTLLDSVRRHTADDGMRQGATLMLEALEPDRGNELRVDATFYVTERREGVAVRFSRVFDSGGSASVVALLDRRADGGTDPDRIRVFASPGFEQPSGFEVALAKNGQDWGSTLRRSKAATPAATGVVREAPLYADVLAAQLWEPLTGNAYADGDLQAGAPGEVIGPFLPALGLDVGDRQIERVFTNSVFTPRMDGFAPEG